MRTRSERSLPKAPRANALHMTKTLALLLLLTTFACSVKRTYQDAVLVPGNAPAAEKLRIAEDVGRHLYANALRPELKSRYGLTDEQLKGLFVRWNSTTVSDIGGSDAPTEPIVTLAVGFEASGELPRAREALRFCAELAEKELALRVDASGQ
jgi:hypothetical protein